MESKSEIIGTTSSGKPIYDEPGHAAHENFTDQDHDDAGNLHADLALKVKSQKKRDVHYENSKEHFRRSQKLNPQMGSWDENGNSEN